MWKRLQLDFLRCIWSEIDLGQDQECLVTKSTFAGIEKVRYNAETERRIKEWILDSSYSRAPDFLCQGDDNSPQDFNKVSDGLNCSDSEASTQSDKPLSPADVASAAARCRNK